MGNSVSHLLKIFTTHRSELVQQVEITSASYCVNSILTIYNFTQWVWRSCVIWIVYQNIISIVTVCNYPMSAVMNIAKNDVALVQVWFDLTVAHFTLECDSKSVDSSPDKQVARNITTILCEPFVQYCGSDVRLDCTCQSHWGRGHQTSCWANGVWGSPKLIVPPGWIALFEDWVSPGLCQYEKD